MTKTYIGYTEGDTSQPNCVIVRLDDGMIYRLPHEERHAASFSWGYRGSGPADLARSLLADYLGEIPEAKLYQQFKDDIVARWDGERRWQLTGQQIKEWLTKQATRACQ